MFEITVYQESKVWSGRAVLQAFGLQRHLLPLWKGLEHTDKHAKALSLQGEGLSWDLKVILLYIS